MVLSVWCEQPVNASDGWLTIKGGKAVVCEPDGQAGQESPTPIANLQVVKGRVLLWTGPAPLEKLPVPAVKKQGQLVARSKKGAKKQVTTHTQREESHV